MPPTADQARPPTRSRGRDTVGAPERSCVGCRTRRPQGDLIRFALRDGRLTLAGRTISGRGAYVCPQQGCLDAAVERRAFARAFRGPVIIDPATARAFAVACEQRKAVR